MQLQLGVLQGSYAADTDGDFPASSNKFCAREAYSQVMGTKGILEHISPLECDHDTCGHEGADGMCQGLQEQAGQQSDYEFLTTYTRVSANHVTAKQREVYYPPRDGLAGRIFTLGYLYANHACQVPRPSCTAIVVEVDDSFCTHALPQVLSWVENRRLSLSMSWTCAGQSHQQMRLEQPAALRLQKGSPSASDKHCTRLQSSFKVAQTSETTENSPWQKLCILQSRQRLKVIITIAGIRLIAPLQRPTAVLQHIENFLERPQIYAAELQRFCSMHIIQ